VSLGYFGYGAALFASLGLIAYITLYIRQNGALLRSSLAVFRREKYNLRNRRQARNDENVQGKKIVKSRLMSTHNFPSDLSIETGTSTPLSVIQF
jgi:hypothetical protein